MVWVLEKISASLSMKLPGWVKHIFIVFSDLLGILRVLHIPREIFGYKLKKENLCFGFDGSSVAGFTSIEHSDLVLIPDLKTLRILPRRLFEHGVAIVFADVYHECPGERFVGDPRFIAQKTDEEVKKFGFSKVICSPEVEFFIFKRVELTKYVLDIYANCLARAFADSPELLNGEKRVFIRPKHGYMLSPPNDQTYEYRMTLCEILNEVGIRVIKSHHEVATKGQIEICFNPGPILTTADNYQMLRFIAKNLAQKMGYITTFMPKPIPGDNGSGLHFHLSLWKDDQNAFYDENDKYAELSQTARYFIGGILEYAEALTALVAPTINSYKRLIPGYEAPVYICWGRKNRSALIRIPIYERGNPNTKRIEIRFPDPLINPYLAFSAIIIAGLEGIRREIDPGDPVDFNVYCASKELLKAYNVRQLPRSLDEALEYLEKCELFRNFFGSEVIDKYIELKRKELLGYRMHISAWEYIMYLHM